MDWKCEHLKETRCDGSGAAQRLGEHIATYDVRKGLVAAGLLMGLLGAPRPPSAGAF